MNLRKMLDWLLVATFTLFLPCLLSAQITLTSADLLGLIGSTEIVLEDRRFNIPVDVGSPGANQVWDFRTQVIGDSLFFQSEFLSPGEIGSANTFGDSRARYTAVGFDANMVLRITDPDTPGFEVFSFYNVTSDFFINVRDSLVFTMPFDTSFVAFENDTLAFLPIDFGDTWITHESDTSGLFPTFATISIDTTINTVDGYGTVRLPLGDFECLRIRGDTKVITQDILLGTVTSTTVDSFITYNWIAKGILSVANVQSQNGDTNPNFTDARGFGRLDALTTGPPPAQTTAYGIDASGFPTINFASVPLPAATPITTIGATAAGGQGGDFGPGNVFYGRNGNNLVTISLTDASVSTVGSITGISSGQTIIGMGFDHAGGTMYLASTDLSNTGSELYTLNLSTAAASLIGTITNAQSVLAIAVNPAGNIFAFDDGADNLLAVDPGTGAGTVVGPLTITSFAQDADFDAKTGTLYWTFFDGSSGRLATVDVSTGAATQVTTWSADFIAFAIFGEPPPGNTAPMAVDDDYGLDEDIPLNVSAPGVLDNDSDPNGDALTATVNTGPSSGSVTLNGNGSFIYTPDANFNGSDSFTYNASDGNGGTATGTVNLTVNPVNDAPGAFDLLGPANGTEVATLNPTLNWEQSQDVDADDAVTYGVVVSTQSDFSDTVATAAKFTGRATSFVVQIEDTTFTIPNGLQPAQDYYWKVIASDNSGAMTESNSAFMFRTSDTATNVEGGNSDIVPKAFSLSQNYPNPFNPETVIQYALDQNGLVELTIFNLLGEKVRTLVDQDQRPGAYQISWNGLDDDGNRASSGLYIYRLTAGASHQTQRMILLR